MTAIDFHGVWHETFFYGLTFITFYMIGRQKIPTLAKILWFYAVLQALYLVEFPSIPYGAHNLEFQATAGQTLIELLLIPLAAIHAPKWTQLLLIPLVFFEVVSIHFFGSGLMTWTSFDTALLALCMPYLGIFLQIPALLTIGAHHGTTALVILFFQSLCFKLGRWLAPVVLFLGWVMRHEILRGTESRVIEWLWAMNWWGSQSWKVILLGTGPGTFLGISLLIGSKSNEVFQYLHNDFLQVLFEYGVVGLTLSVLLLCSLFQKNKIGVLSVVAFSLTYSPLRLFPTELLFALILSGKINSTGG